ncbi:MAG: hypothetical protein COB09_18420 [Thalassobium sp.]|nr:MAG: hypothetical protein COB09_18420 [Thalassobium sp.]
MSSDPIETKETAVPVPDKVRAAKKKRHPLLCSCDECSVVVGRTKELNPIAVEEPQPQEIHPSHCCCSVCKPMMLSNSGTELEMSEIEIKSGDTVTMSDIYTPTLDGLSVSEKEVGKHYNIVLYRYLTDEEIESRTVKIKLDPYRLAEHYTFSSSAMEHIFKKSIRNTSKGATEEKVLTEIIATAKRQLEILEERKLNL